MLSLISWEGKKYDTETLSIDRVLNKEHFYGKNHIVADLFFILINNPKQPMHAKNYFKNNFFWKRIIKNP